MTILITGASGFIGRRLAAALGDEADIRALVCSAGAMPGEVVG